MVKHSKFALIPFFLGINNRIYLLIVLIAQFHEWACILFYIRHAATVFIQYNQQVPVGIFTRGISCT